MSQVPVKTTGSQPSSAAARASIPSQPTPLIQPEERDAAVDWLDGAVDRAQAQDLGSRLFQTLFVGAIRERFRDTSARVGAAGGLRIVLYLPPSLVALPWELMYDADEGLGFLSRSSKTAITRHFTKLPAPNGPPDRGPLRILVVSASPGEFAPLTNEQEVASIRAMLATHQPSMRHRYAWWSARLQDDEGSAIPARVSQMVEITVIEHATRKKIAHVLQEGARKRQSFHVVHFIGHGAVYGEDSYLVLEWEQDGTAAAAKPVQSADELTAEEFAELVSNPSLNLVILNACQTAAPAAFFNSAAYRLLQHGAPAVIGMQTPVLDQTALEFTQEFYYAWAGGAPIEEALAQARQLITQRADGEAANWSIPVLFMGPAASLKLTLEVPPWRLPWPVRKVWTTFGAFVVLLGILTSLLGIPGAAPAAAHGSAAVALPGALPHGQIQVQRGDDTLHPSRRARSVARQPRRQRSCPLCLCPF